MTTKLKKTLPNTNYCVFDDDDEIYSNNVSISNSRTINLDTSKTKSKSNSKSKSGFEITINEVISEPTSKSKSKSKSDKDPIIATFEEYFPNKTIKPLQYDIIKAIQNKKDTVAILPTGYGKSMCYQLPFLLNPNKILIVVSPLISLMEDQKDKLVQLGLPVECFHSNMGQKKKNDIKDKILEDLIQKYDAETNTNTDINGMVIFLTPEYLIKCQNWIQQLASKDRLSLVALDEAHCISTWGHDFRPDYQGMYRIKEWVPNVPILALTATATKQVEEDIITYLQLENPQIFKTSFDRPNLIISVKSKPTEFDCLIENLDKYKNDFVIIYCKTRDKTEELCDYLKEYNYNVGQYHAGLSAKSRLEIQEKFANKELNIIVATVAFGMGIDQTVRLVIHWGCPSDMESYYQEIGRAGRDGIDSECIMFYDKDDFRISRYFIKSINDAKYRKYKDEQVSKMERYCILSTCRRKTILEHFDETLSANYKCNKCDNCMIQNSTTNHSIDNLLYPIYIIMRTIFNIKSNFGLNKLTLIVKGSKSKLVNDFTKCQTYNMLNMLSDIQIKNLINILIINQYLKEKTISSGFGTVLEPTSNILKWYNQIENIIESNSITFDDIQPILINIKYKLKLNIPTIYNNVLSIKFKFLINNFD
jgi:ATP-dependent DNA helicase RecQ